MAGTRCLGFLVGLTLLLCTRAVAADRIVKVLPQWLDQAGRHALSPSLFERDAYQAQLRKHPAQCGGLRFVVRWKARQAGRRDLTLRLELVTTQHPRNQPLILETPARSKGLLGRWTRLTLDAGQLKALGDVVAWRVTLREGGRELSEQKSFLW